MIYLSTKFDKDDGNNLREIINNCWKDIYKYLGKNEKNVLEDDDFLKAHWLICFDKYDRSMSDPHKEFLLKKYFILNNINKNTEDKINAKIIEDYAMSLKDCIKHYYFLHNLEDSDYIRNNEINNEILEWLEKIQRLNFGAFEPLLMAALNKKNKNDFSDSEFLELLKHIERFIFLMFNVTDKRASFELGSIYKLSYRYFNDNKTIKEVSKEIEKIYSDAINLDVFKTKIKEYFDKGKCGYYNWKGIRYFLFEYEDYLRKGNNNNTLKIKYSDIKLKDIKNRKADSTSIEHVLPQTPSGEWKEIINQTNGIKYLQAKNKESNIYKLIHSLGNLVLVSQSVNSELSNKPYSEKRERFRNGSYSEIKISKNDNWGREEIENRSRKLLEFMFKRWGIDEIIENQERDNIIKELVFPIS